MKYVSTKKLHTIFRTNGSIELVWGTFFSRILLNKLFFQSQKEASNNWEETIFQKPYKESTIYPLKKLTRKI